MKGKFGLIVLIAVLAASAAASAAEVLITLEGKVIDARDNSPVVKAEVVLRGEVATTDADGRFEFKKIDPLAAVTFRSYRLLPPDKKNPQKVDRYEYCDHTIQTPFAILWVNAEVEVTTENQRRLVPASGWKIVDLSRPGEIAIAVAVRDGAGEFCRDCHPDNPYIAKRTVKTAKPWPVEIDEDLFTRHRFRDVHPTGFDHRKSAVTRGGKFVLQPRGVDLLDGREVTCFTCHTPHRPTGIRGCVKGEYETTGEFCRRCHL